MMKNRKKQITTFVMAITMCCSIMSQHNKVLAQTAVTEDDQESIVNEVTDTLEETAEDTSFMTTMQTSTSHVSNMGYWLYRPTESTDEKLPLIIYLHGISERGNDLNKLVKVSLPMYLYNGEESVNAVVIAPQCPAGKTWATLTDDVMELIEQVVEEQNIDRSRISMTGHSLGGIGTLKVAIQNPDYFAAIAPVSANIDASTCSVLTSTEIWAFHGSADYAMGFSIKDATNVVNNAGGDMELTMFSGKAHAITDIVYHNADVDLLDWLANQQRTDILADGTPITAEILATMESLDADGVVDTKTE